MASVSLNDYIPEGCIEFCADETFLQSASRAAELLSSVGAASSNYSAEVVQIVNERGPYMVVAPQVAIVHGRPSGHTLKTAASLVISSVDLLSGSEANDPVRLIFAISATSDERHLEMLQSLSNFLVVPGVIRELQSCSTVSEVRQIISNNLP